MYMKILTIIKKKKHNTLWQPTVAYKKNLPQRKSQLVELSDEKNGLP